VHVSVSHVMMANIVVNTTVLMERVTLFLTPWTQYRWPQWIICCWHPDPEMRGTVDESLPWAHGQVSKQTQASLPVRRGAICCKGGSWAGTWRDKEVILWCWQRFWYYCFKLAPQVLPQFPSMGGVWALNLHNYSHFICELPATWSIPSSDPRISLGSTCILVKTDMYFCKCLSVN